ncbi:MAG: hypothetical protein ACREMA_13595 [Longimicrobiales bacterium]
MTLLLVALAATAALQQHDTLPLRHQRDRNVLSLNHGRLQALEINPAFAYVGGQRFILGGTADAEQHIFVVADSRRAIQRLYWIQIEERLPDRPGTYTYDADSVLIAQGFELRANVRAYTTTPTGGSDRARAFALLHARGYTVPDGATRARLIYLPEPNARREVMVIYIEPPASVPNAGDSSVSLIERAIAGLTLRSNR